MKKKISASKEFIEEYEEILRTRKSIREKVQEMHIYLENQGIDSNISKSFDFQPLPNNYFRFKFPPFRVIIKETEDMYIFKKIFKRKGQWDYKGY